jgi:hypothetical protein
MKTSVSILFVGYLLMQGNISTEPGSILTNTLKYLRI